MTQSTLPPEHKAALAYWADHCHEAAVAKSNVDATADTARKIRDLLNACAAAILELPGGDPSQDPPPGNCPDGMVKIEGECVDLDP